MRTEDLIVDLASRVTPVRPLPAPWIRAVVWCAIALAAIAAGLAAFGVRSDVVTRAGQVDFVWIALLGFGTTTLAAFASLVLAVPGAERSPLLRTATAGLVGLWAVTLAYGIARDGQALGDDTHWPICFGRVIAIGFVPTVALLVMLRRAAPLRPRWTGTLALGGATAAGALAIQFICPIDDASHTLAGHLGPVLVMAALGAAAAIALLRPGSRSAATETPQ